MRATWYILEDGSFADPNECAPGNLGRLVHKSGVAVAMRGDIPSSTGVDLDDDGKPLFGGKGDHDGNGKAGGAAKVSDMQPEDQPQPQRRGTYKTRKAN